MAVQVALNSGSARMMPMLGMGTARFPVVPEEDTKNAVLAAIEVGYRHFDTAAIDGTEKPLGDAIAEALRSGLLQSREEVFVTSKLWCTQCHPDLVLRSLRESLKNLQMEYLDLYLIHWPVSMNPGSLQFTNNKREDAVPFDYEGVWRAMEECQSLGLATAIGVSNFTTKHLEKILETATVPPDVNQVELGPEWQQRTLRDYCANKDIRVAAYSPLGGQNWGEPGNAVMESPVLAEIAKARGKTIAQVSLRWRDEEGVTSIVNSYDKETLKQSLEIYDWGLTQEDCLKISQIPQKKMVTAETLFLPDGEFTSVDSTEMDIVEE